MSDRSRDGEGPVCLGSLGAQWGITGVADMVSPKDEAGLQVRWAPPGCNRERFPKRPIRPMLSQVFTEFGYSPGHDLDGLFWRLATMRKIELRTVDGDIKGLYVDGDYAGMNFTKGDMNAMLDDLVSTSLLAQAKPRGRGDLMAELISRTMVRCNESHPLSEGPLSPEELREVVRMVTKACKQGWF